MKKRVLSIALSIIMLVSVFAVTASAAYTDIDGHWGERAILNWHHRGIVNGMGDGTFQPDGDLTRAQAATIFMELLNLSGKGNVSAFADVDANAWYYDAISACVSAGILNGTSATTMDPNGTVTREQMFTMFARALGIVPEATSNKTFADSHHVSDWAAGYINALSNAGYISGVSESSMAPAAEITRASVMTLLDNTITVYASEPNQNVVASGDGITLIVADNVTVSGTMDTMVVAIPTEGDVAPTVTLKSATVNENLHVVNPANVQVTGNTTIPTTVVTENAAGSSLNAAAGTVLGNVDVQGADTTISGQGSVGQVTVSGNNAAITTPGTKVEVTEGTTGVTQNGRPVESKPEEPTPPAPSTPSSPVITYYNLTMTLTRQGETSPAVTRVNETVIGQLSGAGEGASNKAVFLSEAGQLANDAYDEFRSTFGDAAAKAVLDQMITAVQNAIDNNDANDTAWETFLAAASENQGTSANSLKTVLGSNASATFDTIGEGEWEISYTVNGTTYVATITIAER